MSRGEIKAKFDEIVAFAEVERFLDTPVKRFSSGMYVRLAFAVAAHLQPEILIVDEVLTVGDAGFQKKCLGKMNEVSRARRTVLVVSHNTAVLSSLCTTRVVLHPGRVRASAARVLGACWVGPAGGERQRLADALVGGARRRPAWGSAPVAPAGAAPRWSPAALTVGAGEAWNGAAAAHHLPPPALRRV